MKQYDYTTNGFYFVTISSNYHLNFSDVEKEIILRHTKKIEDEFSGVKIDFYQIMNNHFHLIVVLDGAKFSLGEIIRRFKSKCSLESGRRLWQPGYYEHIIRTEKALDKIREYIKK